VADPAERHAVIEELAAALAARQELGSRMEPHVVESFVERIERSIDKRVDERLAERGTTPARTHGASRSIVFWSLVFGVGATAIVSTHLGDTATVIALIVIWAAIAAINLGYARGGRLLR
jgi:hypothetical protein